jgi:hypothetical protein
MTHKFTPGPWYAVEYGGFCNIQDESGYSESNILDAEIVGNDVAEANAKIAAASPELLKALKDLVKGLLDSKHYMCDSIPMHNALSAIKKATE